MSQCLSERMLGNSQSLGTVGARYEAKDGRC